ncbi:hypothetical protein [Paraburkholderia sp. J12]|uniref:hypothetical protein n=1 Tax=Paraburkholderia sp. J12 TaxID=2805432 RepID=UPI0039F5DE50
MSRRSAGNIMQSDFRDSLQFVWQRVIDLVDAATRPASDDAVRALLDETTRGLRALDDDTLVAGVNAAHHAGRVDEAIRITAAVARLSPDRAGAHFAAGLALQYADRHAEALKAYRFAYAIKPDFHHLRNNLAVSLMQTDPANPEIIGLLEQAVIDDPGYAGAWINLSRLRPDETTLARAEAAAQRAVTLAPDDQLALNNYAMLKKEAQQWDEAEQAARAGCKVAPNDPTMQFNLAAIQLVRGNFSAGWVGHEFRWQGARELKSGRPVFPRPQWRGEPLLGRTLLVWGEQGMGDLLQFCRYVPMLAEHVHREGGKLVWNSFPQMGALLKRSLGEHCDLCTIGGGIADLPHYDCEVSLLSLPMLFGTREDAIPGPVRYLSSDPEAAAQWRRRLAGERRLKVGLVWTGSHVHQRNLYRRVGLECYAAHFGALTGDVAFYSLQPGAAEDVANARAAGFEIADFSGEWRTFDDTAAFVDSLDLVISVCTSTAHLAGALGQPTWVLLDVNPHWVWQLERRDNPWYPNTTLYRQKQFRQWEPVLAEVAVDLAARAAAHRASAGEFFPSGTT